ncbi:sce7725 family protein [Candidatus Enterococcus willemsii]|uniref:Sce7725 family protein n=1 Tax=Candidatus Enterococcus willemsii TaxID=1857215 RepID=A0ABQ6Z2K2_9ENTE|nr:sce7725 family protein [Enterococcus sp. CU12B]KAF1306028.1 hypothetical protein BAU17_03425 [Enterococcus sp. CU12B]
MYYPYFRGKQYDLLALRALIEAKRLSKKVQPIIEPVKNSPTFMKFLDVVHQADHPLFVIQNPQAGAFLTETGLATLQKIPHRKAMILEQPLETVENPSELLIVHQAAPALVSDWQKVNQKILVPNEFRVLQKVQGECILMEDVFTRLPRTQFYQELPDEVFSRTHQTFAQRGFVGFSDFSIDSKIYYEHGYPATVLSLHLVYFEADILRIHHFLSSEDLPSQKEKFLVMMEEVCTWAERLCGDQLTLGLSLLIDNAQWGKFPGMGVMRKAAVMHHMELMSRYLEEGKE